MQAAAALIRRKNHGVSSCRAILFRTACNCAALLRLRLNRPLFLRLPPENQTLPHQTAAIPNKKENQ